MARAATHPRVVSSEHGSTKAGAREHRMTREEIITLIGRIASVLSVIMYVSYVGQIANNLAGHPGTPWQPLAAFFNCVMWTIYGFGKTKRDWPIVVANVPGIFLAAATFVTTFIH